MSVCLCVRCVSSGYDGLGLARQLRADARHRAASLEESRGRKPRLVIVRVGDAQAAGGGAARAEKFGRTTARGVESWWDKASSLESDGIEVRWESVGAGANASSIAAAVRRASDNARNDAVLIERPFATDRDRQADGSDEYGGACDGVWSWGVDLVPIKRR